MKNSNKNFKFLHKNNMFRSKIALIILILQLFQITLQTPFTETSICNYQSQDGYSFNLNKMRKTFFDYKFDYMKYTYKANFCGPLISSCNRSSAPAALFLKKGFCIGKFTKYWSAIQADYYDNDIKTNGIKLTFQSGERCMNSYNSQYILTYTIKCDPNEEGKLETVKKVNICGYDYVFSSKYGCPIGSISSSFSKTILFYLFIAFSLYVCFFTYINYKENPEDGLIKALPHRIFWREFIETAYFGAIIIYDFIKGKITYYYEAYQEKRKGYDNSGGTGIGYGY